MEICFCCLQAKVRIPSLSTLLTPTGHRGLVLAQDVEKPPTTRNTGSVLPSLMSRRQNNLQRKRSSKVRTCQMSTWLKWCIFLYMTSQNNYHDHLPLTRQASTKHKRPYRPMFPPHCMEVPIATLNIFSTCKVLQRSSLNRIRLSSWRPCAPFASPLDWRSPINSAKWNRHAPPKEDGHIKRFQENLW